MLLSTLKIIQEKGKQQLYQRHLIRLGKKAHKQLITELVGDTFIFASSLTGHFHHGFGRDTAFNAWFLDAAYKDQDTSGLWQKTKKAVLNYWSFQQPDGKIPHELKPYQPEDELGKNGFYDRYKEYYINRDSVDATPLMLIVTPLFIEKNSIDFEQLIPQAVSALEWIEKNMEHYGGYVCYESNPKGLMSQGWMDSIQGGPVDKSGKFIDGYIALVEAQAFVWKAFLLWADLLEEKDSKKAKVLRDKARILREKFNKEFVFQDEMGTYFSHAIVFDKKQHTILAKLDVASINPGLCLWASYNGESIIDQNYLIHIVGRLISTDMFEENAGIYTFAKGHALKNGDGYHNGEKVVWPFASIAVGFGILGLGPAYLQAGRKVLQASLMPIVKSNSFIEQATYAGKGQFKRYQVGEYISCKDQTWTITAYVATLKTLGVFDKVFVSPLRFPQLKFTSIRPIRKIFTTDFTSNTFTKWSLMKKRS